MYSRDPYMFFFFFSSRRRHTRWPRDWSSDVCSSDLAGTLGAEEVLAGGAPPGKEAAPRGRAGETTRSPSAGGAVPDASSAGSAVASGDEGVREGSRTGSDRDWSWEAMVLLTKLGRPPTGAAESRCALGGEAAPPAE